MIKTIRFKTIVAWLLVAVVMVTIFCLSAQEATESSAVSGSFIQAFYKIYLKITGVPCSTVEFEAVVVQLQHIVRKLAHFCIYLLLGFLFANAYFISGIQKASKTILYSLASSAVYAITDEFHQLFVKGRSGEIRDVLIDSSGALTGAVIFLLIISVTRMISRMIHRFNP